MWPWVLELIVGYVMITHNISNLLEIAVLRTIGLLLKSPLIFSAFQFHGEAPIKVA
jgi:hypothetical protein